MRKQRISPKRGEKKNKKEREKQGLEKIKKKRNQKKREIEEEKSREKRSGKKRFQKRGSGKRGSGKRGSEKRGSEKRESGKKRSRESKSGKIKFKKKGREEKGLEIRDEKRKIHTQGERTGRVKRHPDGFGFLISDEGFKEDVYLPKNQMWGVMGNDRVRVLVKKRNYGKYLYGHVLSVLERNVQSVSGAVRKTGKNFVFLVDHSKSWGENLRIYHPPKDILEKDWVLVDILTYPGSQKGFTGQIRKVIKNPMDSSMDVMRVLYTQSVPHEFDDKVIEEACQLPDRVRKEDFINRRDLRHLDFITIDGSTAKDFDDALYIEDLDGKSNEKSLRVKKGVIEKVKKGGFKEEPSDQMLFKTGFRVYVGIADVSHYVRPGSALDLEAFKRGNSTYFPGFVVPMLPEKLSNEICSLNPHEDRLAFVMEAHVSPQGNVMKSSFYEAVIQSKARLTYGEVQEVIDQYEEEEEVVFEEGIKEGFKGRRGDGKEEEWKKDNQEENRDLVPLNIKKVILKLKFLAHFLIEERVLRGALDLDILETEVELDESGEPLDVVQSKRLFSHCLIEEYMILANKEVAQYLNKKKKPFLSRVHEPPLLEDLENLNFFLKAFGFPKGLDRLSLKKCLMRKSNDSFFDSSGELQRSINAAISYFSKTPRSAIFSLLVLRSLSQAQYGVSSIGHFGLNLKNYTHFTSPIRRYSDVTVHRALKEVLAKNHQDSSSSQSFEKKSVLKNDVLSDSYFKNKSYVKRRSGKGEGFIEELKAKGVALSACEQRSVKAERQVLSIKKARFLNQHLGECFDGMISSVKKFGIFVVLKDFDVDGLIYVRDLKGGYLEYDERELKLCSFKTGVSYAIGDLIRVQVAKVNVEDGKVNFLLA